MTNSDDPHADEVFISAVKMCGKRVENIEELRTYIKLGHLVKQILFTELGKFMGPITYVMRHLINMKRNSTLTQSLVKMLQKPNHMQLQQARRVPLKVSMLYSTFFVSV